MVGRDILTDRPQSLLRILGNKDELPILLSPDLKAGNVLPFEVNVRDYISYLIPRNLDIVFNILLVLEFKSFIADHDFAIGRHGPEPSSGYSQINGLIH